jgi:autotransporter-associated beta strand protein
MLKVPGMRAIRLFARQQLNGRAASLLATTALVAVAALMPGAARAQNATWLANPGSGDFNNATNWTPGAVPTGTAVFGASSNTDLSFSAGATTVDGWTFNAGASAYTFTNGQLIDFTGAGIMINVGSANITNTNTGILEFSNGSTAGSASITNGLFLRFFDSSTAGNATITNINGMSFLDGSTAGNASIINNIGNLSFNNTSTAGSATITTNSGAGTSILDSASGGTARFILNGGILDIEGLTIGGTTAGSIEGAGSVFLGSKNLTVGGNNLSTTFSGVIQDGGLFFGTGGSLTKTGTGTLTLSGINTYTGATTVDGGTLAVSGSIASSSITNNSILNFQNGSTAGSASITNTGTLEFFDTSTAGNASITNNIFLAFTNNSTAGSATITTNLGGALAILNNASGGTARFILNGGVLDITGLTTGGTTAGSIEGAGIVDLGSNNLAVGGNNLSTTFSGSIEDGGSGGSLTKTGTGTLTLSGLNTYTGGTTINGGTLAISADSNLGNALGGITFNGGTLQTSSALPAIGINRAITLQAGGGTIETLRDTTLGGDISGGGGLTKTGAFGLAFQGNNTYSGTTNLNAGFIEALSTGGFSAASAFNVASGAVLDLNGFNESIGSLAGAGSVTNGSASGAVTLTTGADNTTKTFSGTISDGGLPLALTKVGSGTQILSGINTYTGPTTVDAGTLAVNGSIASSSLLTVNAGGTLGGNGTVGNATINAGGALAPGNSIGLLTVQGSLTFTAAASYIVEVLPSNADRTNVTGVATLGGATVNASFAAGTFIAKQYTIVHATGGVTGTFGSQVNTNLPSGFHTSLSTDQNNAYLNLVLNFVPPPNIGLSGNQQRVGNAIVGFFNSNGGIPMMFGGLSSAGLTQASGETATGSQQTTFDAMNQFMGVMTDPLVGGRSEGGSVNGGATGYADEQALGYAQPRQPNDALGAITAKAPRPVPFEPRWSVWAAGFGGSQTTNGNVGAGSNNTTSSIYGTAVGADYRFSPDTLAGFALAGGGTNFSVNGQGSGRSDLFQAGAFVRHNAGAAYISAALAYGWQDVTTDRTVTAAGADHLRAEFNANAFSGRVEGGYRFVAPVIGGVGLTPYAAAQVTTFDLPAYAEGALSGANTFALAYGGKSVTDPRSELGLRSDKSFAMQDAILTLRGRAAWAHDYDPNRSIGATFQTLPGASFVVNGAAQASDSALVTASAEMRWLNGFSVAATFEGEFSDVTESYAGKGVVSYAW